MNANNLIATWLLSILWHAVRLSAVSQFQLGNDISFDFIIVGGGTGGSVVARRLAESKKYTVLLIHEGGVANDNLNIPALAVNFQNYIYPNEMKFYNSVPQKSASLATGGVLTYPIGISLGGGSSVNGMMWNRGNPLDYDNWADLLNDSSWNYKNMLPFFKKCENYRGSNPTNQRGHNGPISIENEKNPAIGIKQFLQSCEEVGYPIGDPNGPQTPSASLVDHSHNRGRRVSSFSGYIGPILSQESDKNCASYFLRHNLIILLNTDVKRIIFEADKAVGVTFVNHNSSQPGFAKAKKEIILSAGVMDSPSILMRSGIGPKSVLDSANIPVVKYLEGVGKNLHDQVYLPLLFIFGNRSIGNIPSRELTPAAWKQFKQFGTGPYSIFPGSSAQAFLLSSVHSSVEKNWPDLQILPSFSFIDSSYNMFLAADAKKDELVINWALLATRNKCRGTLVLDQSNIHNPPQFDFNFLNHPEDMTALIDGVKLCNRMCEETEAMQKFGCRLSSTPLPGCDQFDVHSDSYYECFIKLVAQTSYHAGGTCKMGRKDDPETVVDSSLRVIGIQNLRIADASVMPVVTNANTQAPVYAIAERAADMILKQIDNEFENNESFK